jgi:hypothetical protein
MLYIVYAKSANYAGYGQHFVVAAENYTQAEDLAQDYIEEFYREQDEYQLVEEGHDLDGMVFGSIETTEPFNQGHDLYKYYKDPSQEQFYIKVNFQ